MLLYKMSLLSNKSSSTSIIILRAVISFIVAIVLIEVASGVVFYSVFQHGNSFDDPVNPLFARGWVEYTEPRTTSDDFLIIVIANSQGRRPDEGPYYSEYLQRLLNDNSDKQYRVLNWSMDGARAAEYVVMLSRLLDYDADLVILSPSGENFVVHESNPIQTYNNDITRLANRLPYRNYLASEFLDRHSLHDPLWMILHNTNLGRFHQYIYDGRDWSRNQRNQRAGRVDNNVRFYQRQEWEEDSHQYVREIFSMFPEVAGDTPFLFGSMPLNYDRYNEQRMHANDKFIDILEMYKPQNDNIFVFNAVRAIDPILFYDGEHYYDEGHLAYATYLYDLIQTLPILENIEGDA